MEAPDPWEEVERKAVETAYGLVDRLQTGMLTSETFRSSLDAIYDTVSGLLPKDTLDLLVGLRRTEFTATPVKRVLMKADTLALLSWVPADELLTFQIYRRGELIKETVSDFSDHTRPISRRNSAITELVAHLTAKGFQEL